jgi:transposase
VLAIFYITITLLSGHTIGLGIPEALPLGREDGIMEKKRTGYQRYPSELKERAVRMVLDLQRSDPSDKSVIARVARQLGVGGESLRIWVKQAQIDVGTRGGLTSEEREELKRLRKENFELQRANDILQAAATFFGAELDRRQKK